MKVYISTDLEGISGVLTFQQTGRDENGQEYEKARHLLTRDVNAAVDGAISGGAEEVVVIDGHGGGFNFIIEELDPRASYIMGPGRVNICPGLDESFDAVLLVGFHAMAGTKGGILDHTQSSTTWSNYYVNGIKMGEIGQEAIIAGHFNIPVIFVSGDKATCEEAKQLLGNIETVAVKEGFTRNCAKILSPKKTKELIKEGVARAIKRIKDFKPYIIKPPLEIKIELQNTDVADRYERMEWKRIDGRTVLKVVDSALKIL